MEERYRRQIAIPAFGEAGQARLRAASVLVVGAGGLGSPALFYLAAAGVGRLVIIDGDRVTLSNLNRQILYTEADLDHPKAVAARERLHALNPQVVIEAHPVRLDEGNGAALVAGCDLVVEASDNLATKALVNRLCVAAGVPLVWGAVERFEGQMGVYRPGHACRACIFPAAADAPADGPPPGIIGAVAGVVGSMQALEAIKVLSGVGRPLVDTILLWEGLTQQWERVRVHRRPDCPVCGAGGETAA